MATTLSNTIKSINPANLDTLAEVQITPSGAVVEALIKSRKAFENWSNLPLKIRLAKIENFQQLLIKHKDEIARLITLESGKPLLESYMAELSGPLDTCAWLLKEANGLLAKTSINISSPLLLGKKHYLQYEALGVIGIISPWNYPFSIPVMTMLMALTAGNTIILKPSEKTPLVGLKIGELFKQAGFSEDIVTIITGGAEVGEQLAKADLARLIFTGSVKTGVKIINAAAPNVTPVSLELGGKDAAIVLPDAPVERTAQAITWGAFTNAGQACASIERVYIVRSENSEALVKRIVQLVSQLKVGDPLLESTEIGPLIDVQQFDHAVNLIEQAVSAGAKIVCGGEKLSSPEFRDKGLTGYFYQPTVLTNVNHTMRIMQEETFGPALPIMIVDSIEEAIKLANESHYALTASIWSANLSRAKSIANKIHVGTVFINDCLYSHAVAELPWGGLKKSGFGRSHSAFGLLDLVNIKHISVDTLSWLPRLWWYPYHASKFKTVRYGLEYMHGKNNKLSNLFGFISNLIKAK
jgi:succinate-semialdehyde dehydrogenase/glutarate-semialdehyde dehydrogenase